MNFSGLKIKQQKLDIRFMISSFLFLFSTILIIFYNLLLFFYHFFVTLFCQYFYHLLLFFIIFIIFVPFLQFLPSFTILYYFYCFSFLIQTDFLSLLPDLIPGVPRKSHSQSLDFLSCRLRLSESLCAELSGFHNFAFRVGSAHNSSHLSGLQSFCCRYGSDFRQFSRILHDLLSRIKRASGA